MERRSLPVDILKNKTENSITSHSYNVYVLYIYLLYCDARLTTTDRAQYIALTFFSRRSFPRRPLLSRKKNRNVQVSSEPRSPRCRLEFQKKKNENLLPQYCLR